MKERERVLLSLFVDQKTKSPSSSMDAMVQFNKGKAAAHAQRVPIVPSAAAVVDSYALTLALRRWASRAEDGGEAAALAQLEADIPDAAQRVELLFSVKRELIEDADLTDPAATQWASLVRKAKRRDVAHSTLKRKRRADLVRDTIANVRQVFELTRKMRRVLDRDDDDEFDALHVDLKKLMKRKVQLIAAGYKEFGLTDDPPAATTSAGPDAKEGARSDEDKAEKTKALCDKLCKLAEKDLEWATVGAWR